MRDVELQTKADTSGEFHVRLEANIVLMGQIFSSSKKILD
jgi:hypothetical protein